MRTFRTQVNKTKTEEELEQRAHNKNESIKQWDTLQKERTVKMKEEKVLIFNMAKE